MKRTFLNHFALVITLAAIHMPLAAQETVLNQVASPARGPRILALEQGRVIVVWQGWLNGQNRIFLRERINGEWSVEQIVDSGAGGDHILPQIRSTKIARDREVLYLAWINRKDRTDSVCFGRYDNGKWTYSEPWSFQEHVLCESLSISPASKGSALLAYQARHAGQSSIGLLHISQIGIISPISIYSEFESEDAYKLYPQVFQYAPMSILWFQSEDDRFSMTGAEPGAGNYWEPIPLDELLPSLNASRLPMLFEGRGGEFIGLWHDSVDGVDRILISRYDDTDETPQIVDSRPEWNNTIPAGAISDTMEIAVAWVGETIDGPAIFVRRLGDEQPPLQVPCKADVCSFPQLAFSPEGTLMAVWQSDINFSGAGDIYFQEIPR